MKKKVNVKDVAYEIKLLNIQNISQHISSYKFFKFGLNIL